MRIGIRGIVRGVASFAIKRVRAEVFLANPVPGIRPGSYAFAVMLLVVDGLPTRKVNVCELRSCVPAL